MHPSGGGKGNLVPALRLYSLFCRLPSEVPWQTIRTFAMSTRRPPAPPARQSAPDAEHAAFAQPEARENESVWPPAGDSPALLPSAADLADKEDDGADEAFSADRQVRSAAGEGERDGSDAPDGIAQALSRRILTALARQQRPMRLDGLLRVLGLPRRARKELEAALDELAREGKAVRQRGGLWSRADSLREVRGRYMALRSGAGGFVTPIDARGQVTGPDVFIHPLQAGEAWHTDLVRVLLAPRGRQMRGRSPEGRIVEVLERGCRQLPAHVLDRAGGRLHCRAADSRLDVAFSVDMPAAQLSAPPPRGALVLLEPERRLASDLWQARLLEVIGHEDSVAVQENLVKLNHQVPLAFPPRAEAEAQALPPEPSAGDMAGREDLRPLVLVTIDGADARDFDDAIGVEALPDGWLLRVAIADVSHYVRPRTALDTEALARGNSWYFPASVEPMLPPALSNGLCSLNPGTNRLCLTAEVRLSRRGLPVSARFFPAVMRSAARLTYEETEAALVRRDPAARARLTALPRGEEILAMLEEAFRLYAALHAARTARGSLDFDLPEARYDLTPDGRLAGIGRRERLTAHRLIEECMLAANEAVARFLGGTATQEAAVPFLYRVHPRPDAERLEALFDSLKAIAPELLPPRPEAASLQGILEGVRETEQEFLINRLCLRAMPQARYQPWNEGHFGLASPAYCHFTSPIRRYADLLVHRALKQKLGCGAGSVPGGQKLLRVADQLNRREREALECEREMARRLGCIALRDSIGQRFDGVVSGVTEFGVFVELEAMPVEGMIRVEDLGSDWFALDERRHALVGQRGGAVWALGQPVAVRLADVHTGRLEIRLVPADGRGDARHGRPGRQRPPQRQRRFARQGRAPGATPAAPRRSGRPARRQEGRQGRGRKR